MFNPDITWLTSTVPAGVFAKRVTRKDAHRWGSLPNTSGSRLHTWVSDDIATWRRLAIKAECRKGPLCLWPQLDIALNRHHCLAKVGRPALWRSTCTLPRVQRVVQRIDSVRQRSNFRPLLASHPGGSLHGGRLMWHHFRHRRLRIVFGWQRTESPHQVGVQPHQLSPREALQVPKDIVHGWTKLVDASPARAKTHKHQKQVEWHEMRTCSVMMETNTKQLTSAILFATTVNWVTLWVKELLQFTTAHFPSWKTIAGCRLRLLMRDKMYTQ